MTEKSKLDRAEDQHSNRKAKRQEIQESKLDINFFQHS